MQSREQALNVIQILEQPKMEGSPAPLSMTWVESELQSEVKKVVDGSNADNRMLFFAKVHRSATKEEVKTLFSQFGKVFDVNLFHAFQGAPTTKGCGLVTMGTLESAVAAIDTLDSKFVWEGVDAPMVVKWMDTALQRRRREQHLAALRQGLVPSMPMGPDGWVAPRSNAYGAAPDASLPPHARMGMGLATSVMMMNGGRMMGGMDMFDKQETPPASCARDAIKLFAGNIPKSCTEDQLMPFFETIGKVVELVIVRDKVTQESKGSAFVWYATRSMAERAILQFNLRHKLPDASGVQDRLLVLRRAKARAKPMVTAVMQHYSAVGMLTGAGGAPHMMDPGFVDYSEMMQGQQPQQAFHASYYPNMTSIGFNGVHAGMQPQTGGMGMGAPYPHHLVGLHGAGSSSMGPEAGLYDPYGQGGSSGDMDGSYRLQGQPMRGGQPQNQVAISISINQQQLNAVNGHMYSVQAMSAAQLNVMSGAPGVFQLVVSGSKDQVDTARNLLSTIFGSV